MCMRENKHMGTEFWCVNTKKIGHLGNLVGVNGTMILKWMLKKGMEWLDSYGSVQGPAFVTLVLNFRIP